MTELHSVESRHLAQPLKEVNITKLLLDGEAVTVTAGTINAAPTGATGRTGATGPTGTTVLSGSGSPEGAVTGPLGSLYVSTAGGTGTTLYAKETGGTANTGWHAIT
jgi:hypothetical protein